MQFSGRYNMGILRPFIKATGLPVLCRSLQDLAWKHMRIALLVCWQFSCQSKFEVLCEPGLEGLTEHINPFDT